MSSPNSLAVRKFIETKQKNRVEKRRVSVAAHLLKHRTRSRLAAYHRCWCHTIIHIFPHSTRTTKHQVETTNTHDTPPTLSTSINIGPPCLVLLPSYSRNEHRTTSRRARAVHDGIAFWGTPDFLGASEFCKLCVTVEVTCKAPIKTNSLPRCEFQRVGTSAVKWIRY